jgi:hypothetical protein
MCSDVRAHFDTNVLGALDLIQVAIILTRQFPANGLIDPSNTD